MLCLSVPRRAMFTGTSLSVTIPSEFSRVFNITRGMVFYAYLDADKKQVVYTQNAREAGGDVEAVKIRVQTTWRGKPYYAITIPARFARALKLREGSDVIISLCGSTLTITPLH